MKSVCLFVTEEIPITVSRRAPEGSLAKPLSLLFLTPRLALSSYQHRTLVWKPTLCSLTSKSYYCSPRTLSCWMYQTAQIALSLTPGFPQRNYTVNKLSADAGSLWTTVRQASRPQVILKIQPPICLTPAANEIWLKRCKITLCFRCRFTETAYLARGLSQIKQICVGNCLVIQCNYWNWLWSPGAP